MTSLQWFMGGQPGMLPDTSSSAGTSLRWGDAEGKNTFFPLHISLTRPCSNSNVRILSYLNSYYSNSPWELYSNGTLTRLVFKRRVSFWSCLATSCLYCVLQIMKPKYRSQSYPYLLPKSHTTAGEIRYHVPNCTKVKAQVRRFQKRSFSFMAHQLK